MVSKEAKTLTVFALVMINVAAVANLAQLSVLAEYGLSAIFFIGAASLIFFVPVALVSAELATGWPQTGGVYIWVKEAFGKGWAFLAMWLLWFENVIWYPTILSFAAATIAFIFNPALATNPIYTFAIILLIAWGATFMNLRGMKTSSLISTFGVWVGVLFPLLLIIALSLIWLSSGGTPQIDLSMQNLVPEMGNLASLVFLVGVLLSLSGMEMSAIHAGSVKDPQTNYPKAILISAVIIFLTLTLGSLAISLAIPRSEIVLTAGIMEAFQYFFNEFNILWFLPMMALLIAVGSIGTVSTWLAGPSKGLLVTAKDGSLPPFFQKVNENGMPANVLITQAAIISLLALVFVFMPSVSASYWILTAMTAQLYLIMYLLMFAAAIRLRHSQPDVKRAFCVPGGNAGMWIIAGTGFLASLFAIIIGFVPPSGIDTGSESFFHLFTMGGIALVCIMPLIILKLKKPGWVPKGG